MRILVASNGWPHQSHTTIGANILIFEMLAALARSPGIEVGLLVVEKSGASRPSSEVFDSIRRSVEELRSLGVAVLEPLTLADAAPRRNALARALRPRLSDDIPEIRQSRRLETAVVHFAPDAVIVPLSEWLAAVMSVVGVRKFAYYGNPDPKNRRARLELRRRAGETGSMAAAYAEYKIGQFEQLHVDSLKKFEWLGDVSANDAAYYADRGHSNAFYIRHMWMEPRRMPLPARAPDGVARFIANIGPLTATANTYGLEYLGTELLPAMRQVFSGRRFELHVLGAGEPHPRLASLLRQDGIVLRGFVADLEQEIVDADAFLCVNNATEYKVGHTRYLVAWSLGACVVAHTDASLSMPEIVHGETALLGADARQIAAHLRNVAEDGALRDRIGAGGRAAFLRDFTADRVVPQLLERLRALPPDSRAGSIP